MKDLHTEGLASHGDPESCGGSRKGAVEALIGATNRQGIEPRKQAKSGRRHGGHAWKAQRTAVVGELLLILWEKGDREVPPYPD